MLLAPVFFFSCTLQDRLLYYPEYHVPSDSELVRSGMGYWPERGDGYRGFVSEGPKGTVRGTVIVFHGNAGTAADRSYYFHPLQRLGYRVLLAEYPGYGKREGKPGEAAFVSDARETIRLAASSFGGPLFLVGESLGAAVVASAVRETGISPGGIILFTPWATLERVAREKFPFLPVKLLMTDRYDTAGNLMNFSGRVAVVAAERDDIVPARHARELFNGLPGMKRFWSITGADHNDWPAFISDATWKDIMGFISGP